jgi:hypothetical protein
VNCLDLILVIITKGEKIMENKNYSTTFLVDQTPDKVFVAINNVRGWWSQEIDGDTDKPGAVYTYHYKDSHICKFKITEFVPGKKVVWHVLANYFNFTKDKTEWKNTDVVFEISRKKDKTEVRFTHAGLVPAYECYEACSNAWGLFINGSLHDLITTGKGNPLPWEETSDKVSEMSKNNFTTSFVVDKSPDEVFSAVNNVRGWWSEEIEGGTNKPGDVFKFHHLDVHNSTHQITEFVPGKKIVWHTVDSRLNFIKDKTEWNGTDVIFEISNKDGMTELRFTHIGLNPKVECYGACSEGWSFYINESLKNLIIIGKGQPNRKEKELESKKR